MPTININSVPANSICYVNGIVDYSRIATRLEGDELAADNARKVSKGMQPTDKPHTRISIKNASVAYETPGVPTIAEQYIAEKFYQSKMHPEKGPCYTGMNKSRSMPQLYHRPDVNANILKEIPTEHELAAGTNVTLMLRFFSTNQNNGVSVEGVIVNGELRWASSSRSKDALINKGFEIQSADSDTVANVRQQLEAVPAAQPTAAPAATAPTTAAPYAAYTEAPANQTVTASAIPAPAPAPAANTAPAAAPTSSLPTPPKGYTYDANGRLVPETNAQSGGIHL